MAETDPFLPFLRAELRREPVPDDTPARCHQPIEIVPGVVRRDLLCCSLAAGHIPPCGVSLEDLVDAIPELVVDCENEAQAQALIRPLLERFQGQVERATFLRTIFEGATDLSAVSVSPEEALARLGRAEQAVWSVRAFLDALALKFQQMRRELEGQRGARVIGQLGGSFTLYQDAGDLPDQDELTALLGLCGVVEPAGPSALGELRLHSLRNSSRRVRLCGPSAVLQEIAGSTETAGWRSCG